MLIFFVCLLSAFGGLNAVDQDDEKISVSQQKFSTDMFREIFDENPSKDIIFSPYSVYSTLVTMYLASSGKTQEIIEKVLHFDPLSKPDKQSMMKMFSDDAPQPSKDYELLSGDRVYFSSLIKLIKEIVPQLKEKLEVFKTTDKRGDEINKWISDRTKGMIKELFTNDELKDKNPSEPVAVFVNAAYFKGSWVHPFQEKTNKMNFNSLDGNLKNNAEFMSLKAPVNLITDQELEAHVLSLPYKGDDISMIIVLPTSEQKTSTVLANVIKKLTYEKFKKVVSTLESSIKCTGDISVPKFKTEEKYQLKQALEALGGHDFLHEALNFTNIFEPKQNFSVSEITQKARIEMYQNGTKAAAATGIVVVLGPMLPTQYPTCPTKFTADHPFAYIIYDKRNRYIYFMGVLVNPNADVGA